MALCTEEELKSFQQETSTEATSIMECMKATGTTSTKEVTTMKGTLRTAKVTVSAKHNSKTETSMKASGSTG